MAAHAADAPPSQELLLYLAEFADDDGKPEDPTDTPANEPEPAQPTERNHAAPADRRHDAEPAAPTPAPHTR